MPSNEQKLQAELSGMQALDIDTSIDPTNCPTCRSGVIEYPPLVMADVVSVEL